MAASDSRQDRLNDDEIVGRRIPPDAPWFQPPDQVTSFNFKLRPGEPGLSVFRLSLADADAILSTDKGAIPGSRLAAARVGDIRRLENSKGEPLHLDVVSDDEEGRNPGHAIVIRTDHDSFSHGVRKALNDVFRLLSAGKMEQNQ